MFLQTGCFPPVSRNNGRRGLSHTERMRDDVTRQAPPAPKFGQLTDAGLQRFGVIFGISRIAESVLGHIIQPIVTELFSLTKLSRQAAMLGRAENMLATAQNMLETLKKMGYYGLMGAGGLSLLAPVAWVKSQAWLYGNKLEQDVKGAIRKVDLNELRRYHLDDIVGHEKIKAQLDELRVQLANPALFKKIFRNSAKGNNVCGVFTGPSGTGKTHLVKAFANKLREDGLDAAMFETPAAQLVGTPGIGPKKVEEWYKAINNAPEKIIIAFMDEADSLGSRKALGAGSEGSKTINEVIQLRDGVRSFKGDKTILWFDASNHEKDLDSAIRNRIQLRFHAGKPSGNELEQMYSRSFERNTLEASEALDMPTLLAASSGFTGRQVESAVANLLRELGTHYATNNIPIRDGEKLRFTQAQILNAIRSVSQEEAKAV
jgi:AAA+ superfamily predicted ATPase